MTQFEYNARSQMTAVVDALTQRYDFSYDALGRQLTQTKAGSTMAYEYDAVGNRTKRTDYLSQITNYTYDNLNRLTNVTYPDATENITLTYDVISQLTKATKNAQDVSFVYDKRRQVASTTDIFGKVIAYTLDATQNRTTLKLDGTNFATYAYDVANRLTKITNSADAKAVSYTYDNANRMTKETLPNTTATTFNYDGMSRLKEIKDVKGAATTLFDRNYAYNTANQISQIAETAQTRNFGYDNLDRLTSVTGSTSENYAFDAVGNRTSSQLSATYNYQPFNRLTNTATTSYVYNSNGNMTQKTVGANTTQYIWDYENRLKQVILPSGQNVVYKYDALGRRSERNVNNSASWTKFTYDGQDVILDQNSDGTSVTYLNGLGIDNKIRQTVNGQAQYFLSDHLGSTTALTDATGAVIASTSYDSFGNATNASFPTRYQFTGKEFDNFTGLHYYRARWYDGNLGRFISEDPIGLSGGINQFAYANNNASNLIDPNGLDGESPKGKRKPIIDIPMDGGEPPRRPPQFISDPPSPSPTPIVTPPPISGGYPPQEPESGSGCGCFDVPRFPDFYTVNGGVALKSLGFLPVVGKYLKHVPENIGVGISFTVDSYWGFYGGPHIGVNIPGSYTGANISAGYMLQKCTPTKDQLKNFLSEGSTSVGGFVRIPGMAAVPVGGYYTYNDNGSSLNFGAATSTGFSYSKGWNFGPRYLF
jgi:RHS repeat-associated protein